MSKIQARMGGKLEVGEGEDIAGWEERFLGCDVGSVIVVGTGTRASCRMEGRRTTGKLRARKELLSKSESPSGTFNGVTFSFLATVKKSHS